MNHQKIVKLYYGRKDWFHSICALNDTDLVPGHSLTEKYISKQDCIDTFGDKKTNNGYKVSKNSEFCDRVVWLWKHVHQADIPSSSDIGLKFCQGLLYKEHYGKDTVED